MTINSWGSGLDGGGCMNDNQFMGLWIGFDGGGRTNNARQSIREAPDSMVEDA